MYVHVHVHVVCMRAYKWFIVRILCTYVSSIVSHSGMTTGYTREVFSLQFRNYSSQNLLNQKQML